MEKNKKKAKNFKQVTDAIYNGAWNNLILASSSKKNLALAISIVGLGVVGAFILSNKNKK